MARIVGIPKGRAGTNGAVRRPIEVIPGVVKGIGCQGRVWVAENGAVVADAVAVNVKGTNFDVLRRSALELGDSCNAPVVDNVTHNLHGSISVQDRRVQYVGEYKALPVIVLGKAPVCDSAVGRIAAACVGRLVVKGEDL